MKLLKFLKDRAATRKYRRKKLSARHINAILEAGIWGPSLIRYQPARFIVITNKPVITHVADLLEKKSRALYAGFNTSVRRTSEIIRNAPAIIAVYAKKKAINMGKRLGDDYENCAMMAEVEAVSAAIQNMLLAAEDAGVGGNWYAFPIFAETALNKYFKTSDKLIAIVTLGYPAEKGRRADRNPIGEMVSYIK
jgi:nitroreductase